MTIKKAMKIIKAVKRLKKYCHKREECKGCIFFYDDVLASDVCMIRQTIPDEYDIKHMVNNVNVGDEYDE